MERLKVDVRCLCFVLVIDVWCYITIIILYIILFLFYLILYSSPLLIYLLFFPSSSYSSIFLSFLLPLLPFFSFLFLPIPLRLSFPEYVSALTYGYLYSFTIFQDNPLLIYLPFFSPNLLIQSIRVGSSISLFIFNHPFPNSDPACFIGVDG